MDYQVSARKYRPGTFENLIGQPHVVQTLRNAITGKRIAHAYLFSGMRGVGKTTVARILAKGLNCQEGPTDQPCEQCESCVEITRGNSVDVIEIDGASNTGVDDVRELRENIKFAPFRGTYRIYIIDEVHMLSNSAFNALLKTLEEPPAHAIFVFATTEIHKIPPTILSRCQHFNFRRIPWLEIVNRLREVAEKNGVTVEERGLSAMARASDGSMRDALSLFDQAMAFGGNTIRFEDLESMLGSVPDELVRGMITAILQQDAPQAISLVGEVLNRGYDLRMYCSAVVERIRNLMVTTVVPDKGQARALLDLPEEEAEQVQADAKELTPEYVQELFEIFSRAENTLRGTLHPQFAFEAAVVKATRVSNMTTAQRSVRNISTTKEEKAPAFTPQRVSSPKMSHESRDHQPPPTQTHRSNQQAPRRPQEQLHPKSATGQAFRPSPAVASRQEVHKAAQPTPNAPKTMPKPGNTQPLSLHDWDRVVAQVVQEHPNIGTFLEMGTLVKIAPEHVVIGYPKTALVACSRIQKEENRGIVGKMVQKVAGRFVPIRVIELSEREAPGPTIGQVRATQRKSEEELLLAEARENPLVKQAKEVFGAEIIEAKRDSVDKEAT